MILKPIQKFTSIFIHKVLSPLIFAKLMASLVTSEPNAEMSTDTLEIESGTPRRGGEKESSESPSFIRTKRVAKSVLGSKRVLSFGLMSLFTTAIVVGMSIYVVHNNEFRTKGGKLIDNAGNEVSTAASETEVELSYAGLTDNVLINLKRINVQT
jgi:hypothetical protein